MTFDFSPSPRIPYQIATPPWNDSSAGVRVLHFLCHALNLSGYPAYIVPLGFNDDGTAVNPNLITPIARKLDPEAITIYPDILDGNPLEAKRVVRFNLYYAGRLLKRAPEWASTDQIWAWSKRIADDIGTPNVLTLPPVDTKTFYHGGNERPRAGVALYARKYREVFGGALPESIAGILELTGAGRTLAEVADVLRSIDVLYVFENSTIIREATLCGCPVVCMFNEHFTELLDEDEFGRNGVAFGEAELEQARATVLNARFDYQAAVRRFGHDLPDFIRKTQGISS